MKKLKETLVTVQQLDKNMSNLRSWLSRIEAELSRPITYSVCHHQEIQRRLAEQQVYVPAQPVYLVFDFLFVSLFFLFLFFFPYLFCPLSFIYR